MQKENNRVEKRTWSLVSMTGVGHARLSRPDFNLELVVKSVNSKGLDLKVRLERELQFLETEIMQIMSKSLCRGRIELSLKLESFETSHQVSFDNQAAGEMLEKLLNFSKENPLVKGDVSIGDFLKTQHLWNVQSSSIDEKELREAALEGLNDALGDLQKTRRQEGILLAKPLKKSIDFCRDIVNSISEGSQELIKERFCNFKQRVKEVFAAFKIDKDRLYQECALLVERSDFKEETDRLAAHIEHFSKICQEQGLKGRKLAFLCQEMLRESNTLLTKAHEHEIMAKAIDLKAEFERIREQVQNIE
ncbi:MAG: YicC family protein [Myxococcales bacterium]|nr:YicC family protein [Myxococcales bacterium]